MKQFIVKRLAQMLFVWILVSMFSFSIIYFAPGDPLYIYMTPGATGHKMTDEEMYRMRESLGLNGNVVEQYVSWAKKTARGNLGISISNRQSVLDQILEKLPCTAGLMGASLLLSLAISIPLGLLAGVYKNRLPDHIISGFTYLGISVPAFWLGIMLIIIFSMKLKILPSSGMRTIGVDSAWDLIRHGIMPAIVLGLNNMAVFVRYIRANTIVQLEEEYVQTAISKGLSKRGILYGQVLKLYAPGDHHRRLPAGNPGDRFLYHRVRFRMAGAGNPGNVCHQQPGLSDDYGHHHVLLHHSAFGELPGRSPLWLCRSEN